MPVAPSEPVRPIGFRQIRDAGDVPSDYGFGGRRHSAPAPEAFDELAAVFTMDMPTWNGDALLDIDWAGDVAQLRVDGTTVDDRFWDGTRWTVSLRDVGATAHSMLTLHVLSLSVESTVWLPADAAHSRGRAASGRVTHVALRTRSSVAVARSAP
ncbi:MAG: hypothetical protein WBA87_01450 [Microbacterium sp.]